MSEPSSSRTQDERFEHSDSDDSEAGMRAYAGAPLLCEHDGKKYKLGTLCVVDTTPREVSADEVSLLETIADIVVTEIQMRDNRAEGGSVKLGVLPRHRAGGKDGFERGRLPRKVEREELEELFHLPQANAARKLQMSITSLKLLCRKVGIGRWPCTLERP